MADPLPGVLSYVGTNPGGPSKGSGPDHPRSLFDHLPLPGNNQTIGKTDTDTLRRLFHKMGIPDSHHLGRETLCGRYQELLTRIGREASDKAIADYLDKFKDQ